MTYVLADMDSFASQDLNPLEILLQKEQVLLDNPEIGDILEGKIKNYEVVLDIFWGEITMTIETSQGDVELTRGASDDEIRALECMDIMGKECDIIFTREGWAFNNLYLN